MKILQVVGSFFFTLIIYIGLPLLGWGFSDLNGFFSLPQLSVYAISIALYGVLASYLRSQPGGMGNAFGKGQEDKFVFRQRVVRILITAMLIVALIFVPYADRRAIGVLADYAAIRWAGLVLEVLGMGLIFWSGWALGRFYSPDVTLQKDHHLITSGPYRIVRNPRYLGGIIQGIGLSLLFRSWIGLILTFVFIVLVLYRIKDEEALMHKEFGSEWETYCKKSWRLVPYVY
jgi:protein-S-isoprenylcysteine O-methyltransferase Ste14